MPKGHSVLHPGPSSLQTSAPQKPLRINYTTYDMRRDQDSLNTRNNADIMVLGCENEENPDAHPYWYGRIIGIFHAYIDYQGPGSRSSEDFQEMEFLWVRWLGRDLSDDYHEGWMSRCLSRVGFVDCEKDLAFGFLNPALVVRAIHLIPCFASGRTNLHLPRRSICKKRIQTGTCFMLICKSISRIYDAFLLKVCFRFVDRDMFMRFRGGGVGHKSIKKKITKFCDDRWPEERNDKPLRSSTQPADEDEEETVAAQPKASSLINLNAEDVELCDGENIELPEEEAESDSEDGGDNDSDNEERTKLMRRTATT